MFRFFSVLCFYFFSVAVFAMVIERSFSPQVTIIKNGYSDAIEIKIKQPNVVAVYSEALGSFAPFNAPFLVRSVGGASLNYRIKLQDSQHYCRNKGQADTALLDVVSTTLDGAAFPTDPSVITGSVVGSTENEHVMRVTFSSLPRKNVEQECYGTFILIAEIASI